MLYQTPVKHFSIFFMIMLLVLNIISNSFSQDIKKIDSLEILLNNSGLDSSKIIIQSELFLLYNETDTARANKHLNNLSQEIDNGIITVSHHRLFETGELYKKHKSDYPNAIRYYKKAIDKAKSESDLMQIDYEAWLGYALSEMGENESAVEHLISAVSVAEKENQYSKLPLCYLLLAYTFRNSNNTDKAEQYYNKSLQASENSEDSTYIHFALHELGNIYSIKKEYQKAMAYHKKALEIREKINNPLYLLYSYNDIANNYNSMDSFNLAMVFFKKAEQLAINLDEKWSLFVVSLNINYINLIFEDYSHVKPYLQKMQALAEVLQTKNAFMLLYEFNYKYYKQIEQYKDALKYFEQYTLYRDSISNEKIQKSIRELDKKYDTEKKSNEILFKKAQIKRQRLFIVFAILVIIMSLIFVLIVFTQFKKRLEAYHKLEIQNQKIIQQNATKDRLFSIIGHDLRGPIGGLKTLVEFLLTDIDPLDKEELENIKRLINQSATSTYDLLDNLLYWAKSQLNEIVFSPEKHILSKIVEKSISVVHEPALRKNITIHNKIPDSIVVKADKNMLMIILRNLISNAVKFTPAHKNVIVSATESDTKVTISVKDDGVGIRPENISKLFDPHICFRTNGTLGESGSGLGLILCKEFVDKHKGKIWVESTLGEGSNFLISIPK
ncbi:MAG: tetratricopeptide repeat-containing sensor histidine kinase [Bacteroidales bacterium]|nr:tetratricopeptide repeat-containing sensor histidine kinase [Bacteroidales bacterium]